jgi:hypothetical protein
MLNASVAEWLLSLVASPEQAAGITGDFVEQAQSRGAVWFWWSVVRTWVALPANEVIAHPVEMGSVALKGVGFLLLWQIAFLTPFLLLIAILNNLLPRDAVVWAVYYVLSAASVAISQYLVGKAVARRAAGREFSAWMALAALETVINSVIIVTQVPGWLALPTMVACFLLYQAPALLGVAKVRRA